MLRRSLIGLAAAAALAAGLGAPGALRAQSLDQLRASGAVGERYDGFAQALDASAQSVVSQVNAKRQGIYAERAAKEGVPVEQIGRVYAKQIFQQAPPGTKFLQENGNWVAK